jgi:two-component system CheB/CheR fusion protein
MAAPIPSEGMVLLQALVCQAQDHALLLYGPDERLVWMNGGAERILGRTAREMAGSPASVLFTDEDVDRGVPAHELAVARRLGSAHDDRWSRRPDGSRFWATGLTYALHDASGGLVGYGKIVQNRTDLRQHVDALDDRVRELEALDERKDLTISTLAHELRGPLAPLINAGHLLRRGVDGEQVARMIDRQVDVIHRLVDDLMDATRVAHGKVALRTEPLVLQEVLASSIEIVRPALQRRGQRLDVVVQRAPIVVLGDRLRLQQVFVNLLSNAVQYSSDGGPIGIEATTETRSAVVRIEDEGDGIAPDMLDHIFELFTQARPAGREGGLGIGLSLVKELVVLHGGTVQANSDGLGKGSEFVVRLPLREPDA